MEPFYIRLCTVIFAGLTATTVVNALYFQTPVYMSAQEVDERSNTAAIPEFSSDRRGEAELQLPRTGFNTGTGHRTILSKEEIRRVVIRANTVTDKRNQIVSSDLVIAIQRGLKGLGYNPGPVDGMAGLKTRAATMAFEYDNGLMVLGDSSDLILNKILNARPVKYPRKSLGLNYGANAREVVTMIQKLLAKQGYAPGQIDGLMGEETYAAIMRFEKDRFMPQTGRISGQLIHEFFRVGAKIDQVARN